MYDLIIRNGKVVDAQQEVMADVAVRGGKIAAVGTGLDADATEEIDAAGLIVFPGGIDPHVHFNEPGRADWEGLETGTRALAAGGVTTFFDMPLNSSPPVLNVEAFEAKAAAAREKSLVNAYFWGGLVPGNLGELKGLHRCGVIGFKAFMSNSGIDEFPAADDYTLYEGMRIAADLGALVAVHAENDGICGALAHRAVAAGKVSARDYLESRPVVAELEAIQRAILYADITGCRLHIVHVSSGAGIDLVKAARARGVDVTCETCAHYLVLTDEDVVRLGAVAKCAPPIRSQAEQDALWKHVLAGDVQMVTSDHSPAPMALKQGDNFFSIWGGIAGCQSTLPLLITEGYHGRGMSLREVAAVTSTRAAARFDFDNKGRIVAGADADLALVDIDSHWTLAAEDLQYRHKVSPYVGMEMRAQVMWTLVGGRTVWAS
ncbi:MAG: allantoinase AllB [Chloroflexi bacterium]|nr:allantoinase AllB [Chloroflexota bacterium]